MGRSKLDELGRMRPTAWSRFQSTSIALKAVTKGYPVRLSSVLIANSYSERRKPNRLKFFNKADHKIGNQAIQNRCGTVINQLGFDWLDGFNVDGWRSILVFQPEGEVFPLGWGTKLQGLKNPIFPLRALKAIQVVILRPQRQCETKKT